MPKQIIISGIDVAPGESKQVNLNIASLPSRTPIDIPVNIFRSEEDGPTVLLMAGMHGDELNGVEAIRQMIAKKMLKPKKGSIIAIPLLNVYGFLHFSRQVPDGKDVNRSFPGSKTGSLASRVAYCFMKEIFPHVDYAIDFHTGGGSISNYPQIRCSFDVPKVKELASVFATHFVMNAKLRDKSLRKEFTKSKKVMLVYEGGEALRLQEFAVKSAIRGAMNVLSFLSVIDKAQNTDNKPIIINEDLWIRARSAGLFRTDIRNGSRIKKGDIIGSITDPYGEYKTSVKSSHDGYIVAVNHQPVVNQGDALIHIGIE